MEIDLEDVFELEELRQNFQTKEDRLIVQADIPE